MAPDDTTLTPPVRVRPGQVVAVRSAAVDVRVCEPSIRDDRGMIVFVFRGEIVAREYFDSDQEEVTIRARHPTGPWICTKRYFRRPPDPEKGAA